ncbi:response regulator transcription factor [Paenibacillus sp. LHD-117]|uniref:response regulator transcription factor n=1 Tax=Paenibacillus sp. LHD-117 TaxID=3071412 RepID=UPI0027E073CE|nr:response regulator transcription factor [Paenibacillus sp. LHD-117]MDQ6419662.1 response regulator transcription factor [Paenibacillus sp. LHD-117]
MAERNISVMIVDDQRLLREGLQTILGAEEGLEIACLCENGLEACEQARLRKPDVVLMDIKMPVLDGIEAMKRIKRERPAAVVLMLTTFAEDRFIVEAMAGGADGFLLKDMPSKTIAQTIRDAVGGGVMLPAPIASRLATRLSALSRGGTVAFDETKLKQQSYAFTERERRIILLLIEGYTNRQIATALFMGDGTVRNYVSVIYNKLGTSNRQEAATMLRGLLLDDAH